MKIGKGLITVHHITIMIYKCRISNVAAPASWLPAGSSAFLLVILPEAVIFSNFEKSTSLFVISVFAYQCFFEIPRKDFKENTFRPTLNPPLLLSIHLCTCPLLWHTQVASKSQHLNTLVTF